MTPEQRTAEFPELPESARRALDEAIELAAAQQEANERALRGGDSPYPDALPAGQQAHVNGSVWNAPAAARNQPRVGPPTWFAALNRARAR